MTPEASQILVKECYLIAYSEPGQSIVNRSACHFREREDGNDVLRQKSKE